MLGLAANMELTSNQAQAANAPVVATVPQQTIVIMHQGAAPGTKAAKAPAPIVLTAHAVVHTVSVSAPSSYSAPSYAAAAPAPASAPAAAPVATTSGSH